MRALARHIVICLECTDVQGHANRCMQMDAEMDDVWCTSGRRLVRREKRLCTKRQKGGNSARLTLSRLDTVAVQPRTARATAILGSAHPTRHNLEERGSEKFMEKRFSARFRLVSGNLDVLGFPHSVRQDLSQTGDFHTASIMVGVRASLTLCVCFCVLFPHVHEWHLGDGS